MDETRPNSPLSQSNKDLASNIFRAMDINGDSQISIQEAKNWWKNRFANVNARSFFETVDQDGNKEINFDEWICFWEKVRANGYSNDDIQEELENLQDKGSWVKFELNE